MIPARLQMLFKSTPTHKDILSLLNTAKAGFANNHNNMNADNNDYPLPSCGGCACGLPALRPGHRRGQLAPLLRAEFTQVDGGPFGEPHEAALAVGRQPLRKPGQRPFAAFQARLVPHDDGAFAVAATPVCGCSCPAAARGEEGVLPRCLGASQAARLLLMTLAYFPPRHFRRSSLTVCVRVCARATVCMYVCACFFFFSLPFYVAHTRSCTSPPPPQFPVSGVSVLPMFTATEASFRVIFQCKTAVNHCRRASWLSIGHTNPRPNRCLVLAI